jgi:hypothetical protein
MSSYFKISPVPYLTQINFFITREFELDSQGSELQFSMKFSHIFNIQVGHSQIVSTTTITSFIRIGWVQVGVLVAQHTRKSMK